MPQSLKVPEMLDSKVGEVRVAESVWLFSGQIHQQRAIAMNGADNATMLACEIGPRCKCCAGLIRAFPRDQYLPDDRLAERKREAFLRRVSWYY